MALSHVVLGDTRVADRLPSVLAAWAIGLVVGLLVWRIGRPGRWSAAAGVATALLWWVMPFAPGREAMLESVMALLVVAAQLPWVLAIDRRDPRWLVAGGVLAGLAAASKLTGGLALVGLVPAALLLARHLPVRRVLTCVGLSVGAAALAWVFPFVGMEGDALVAMATPVTFQLAHAEAGHSVVVAGVTYQHAPAWSSVWFFVDTLGPLAAGGLVLAAVLGLARHRPHAVPVATTLGALVGALSLSPVQLPHYQYVWWPLLLVLAGAGLAPARDGSSRRVGTAVTVVAAVALVPSALVGVEHVREVAATQPSGLLRSSQLIDREVGRDATVVVWADPWTTRTALPDQRLTTRMPESLAPRVLLADPHWLARQDEGPELGLWRGCAPVPYTERDLGDVIVLVRERAPHPADVRAISPGCAALRGPATAPR